MDPRSHPHHVSQHPTQRRLQHQQQSYQPALVCVGGMLRVAQLPDLAINTPAPSPTRVYTESTHNVTPFKQLASPFTASAPFTAPTTPTPTIATTPHSTATTIPSTPYSTLTTHSAPQNSFYPLLSPTQTPTPIPTPTRNTTTAQTFDLQPQPQSQLLTQKQVRELRRLCRKTANRAQFEGRLTQIRQVASIAAMANSTVHLFDPTNPTSGHALRAWVEKYRAEGADWRDERPLSSEAVTELRRWDLLLKAWARVRFENHNADTRYKSRAQRPDNTDNMLKPVRLEFEKLSLGASPSPTTPANTQKPRNVYSADFLRLASPVTPAEGNMYHLANAGTAGMHGHVSGSASANTPVSSGISSATSSVGHGGVPEDGQVRSAWSKPPLTGLTRWVDSRKPMTEVSINRVGDQIKVTVPPSNCGGVMRSGQDNTGRFVALNDQENTIPADLRRGPGLHASTTAKSWRNALMQTPEGSPGESGQGLRTAAKTLFPGHEGQVVGEAGMGLRSPLDWGKFRRGENCQSGGDGVWQTSNENV